MRCPAIDKHAAIGLVVLTVHRSSRTFRFASLLVVGVPPSKVTDARSLLVMVRETASISCRCPDARRASFMSIARVSVI